MLIFNYFSFSKITCKISVFNNAKVKQDLINFPASYPSKSWPKLVRFLYSGSNSDHFIREYFNVLTESAFLITIK
jgi:hypothetical protein